MQNASSNTRDLILAAAAIAAACALAAPARAAVIQVSSTLEGSPGYALADAGTARLQGTFTGSASGPRHATTPATATVLPRLVVDLPGANPRIFALDSIGLPSSGPIQFTASVDLELSWDVAGAVTVRPDFVFAQGSSPFSSYTERGSFSGTLTPLDGVGVAQNGDGTGGAAATGAASGTTPVPEPAGLAVLGVGMLGLMAARRRAA